MERKAELEKDVIDARRDADRQQYMENRKKLLDRGIRYGSTYHLIERKEERKQGPKNDESEQAVLKFMIRSDVDGTLEAILNVFDNYSSELCDLQIVDFGVGPPNENNIEIASETGTLIYCFNTSIPAPVRVLAASKGVEIEQHNIIYRLVESVKNRLSAKIPPKVELKQIGEGHVLKEFMVSGSGRKKQPIAGCLVDWGVFNKNATFRIIRGTDVIFEGPVESLKCENQFVNEAKTKMEVGIALDDKTIRFKEDDTIEVLDKEIIPQTIDWHPPGFA